MLLPAMVLPLMLTSCDDDHDSNPTLDLSHVGEGFVLNVPADAANNTYDLYNSESIRLTCSQPNYGSGVPYAVTYTVMASIDPEFLNDTTATHVNLSTVYSTAAMDVSATELNNAVVNMYTEAHPELTEIENVPVMPLYLRLKAFLYSTDSIGLTLSNPITLPSVKATPSPSVEFPTELYVYGNTIMDGSADKTVPPVYENQGNYYTMVYIPAGGQFNWRTEKDGDAMGFSNLTVADNANAGATASGDDNIQFANAGWYTLHFVGEKSDDGKSIAWTLNIYQGAAYLIGATAGGDWTDSNSDWALTAPADQTGEWESPAVQGGGELRIYIKVPGISWWDTEFTILRDNSLFWRNSNIANSWAGDAGAEYSYNVSAGQKVYINFTNNTGEAR